jgi:ABC-2 type transport system ATP-binding protein
LPLGKRRGVENNTSPMVDTPLLSAQNLTRYYHGRKVLHGIDLELHRGEVLGFLGPNGAGKSTTMNILSGVLAPHSGRVEICGYDIAQAPLQAKRHLGYLPENPPLYLDATVDEYLLYCGRLRGLSLNKCRAAMNATKKNCDLHDVGGRLLGNLSKGFRQRVGIAQALLHEPAVVILDEPTSGLDPNQIRTIRDTISALAERHTIILSTHVLSEVQALCTRVAIVHRGAIAFNQLLESPNTLHVELKSLGDPPEWPRIDGVQSGESLGDGCYRLHVEDYDRAADAVGQLALNRNWGLRELRRESSALEQTFVDITCNDTSATL